MSLRCGIVGLPNAGKSTIFNALTSAKALVANYPFTTIEPNVGIVNVPDETLYSLAEIIKPERIVPSTLKFIDIAGLVEGASRGDGLGNRFLGHIREVDALVHVVRCFQSDVSHVFENLDPRRDIEVINLELLLSDLETVEKRLAKVEKTAKSGDKEAQVECDVLGRTKEHLARGKSARLQIISGDADEKIIGDLNLLTTKPVLYVGNLKDWDENSEEHVRVLNIIAEGEKAELVVIFGQFEAELAELPEDEAEQFLNEMGLRESGLRRLVKAGYKLLDLVTFYTTNGVELRAWSVKRGTKAPQAAGRIHSDMERGFIRAEVVTSEDYIKCGSDAKVKESGLLRIEGKDYQIQDEDMVYFRFKN